jgi:hypothetical protein
VLLCQGPYHVERTGSRPITEVKQHWARLVLGWVTAWESRVPLAFFFLQNFVSIISIYETVRMKLTQLEKQRAFKELYNRK